MTFKNFITDWPATELSRAIHARQVSCREVMQAFLERIVADILLSTWHQEKKDERLEQLGLWR